MKYGGKMKIRKIIVLVIMLVVLTGEAFSQVVLTLPTTTKSVGTEFFAAVNINNVSSLNLKSYQFQINYDPAVIKIYDLSVSGTITPSSPQKVVDTLNGKFRVMWASSSALTGSGVLLNIKIKIKAEGSTTLTVVSETGFPIEFASNSASYTVTATDGTISSGTPNNPPTLNMNPTGPYNINGNSPFEIQLIGGDVDAGDVLTYSFTSTPEMTGATIDASSGLFGWTPAIEQAGDYTVVFSVTDGKDITNETTTITVASVNLAPTLSLDPEGPIFSVDEGENLTITLIGNDPNSSDVPYLTYTISGKPTSATFNDNVFSWTPNASQGRTEPYYITFTVTDLAGLSGSVIITVTVNNVNSAPYFTTELQDNDTVEVHTAPNPVYYTKQLSAVDPDGDVLTFGLVSGPGGITSSGLYSWAPTSDQAGQSFVVSILVTDGSLSVTSTKVLQTSKTVTSIDENGMPSEYKLNQNYPNPFNPTTKISFTTPKEGHVKLSVYNVLGQEIAKLVDDDLSSGTYSVDFDGSRLNSGVYVYKLETNDFSSIRKMILEK